LLWTSMRRRRATVTTPGEWRCKTGGVRRLAVANGPNIFQMLLVISCIVLSMFVFFIKYESHENAAKVVSSTERFSVTLLRWSSLACRNAQFVVCLATKTVLSLYRIVLFVVYRRLWMRRLNTGESWWNALKCKFFISFVGQS